MLKLAGHYDPWGKGVNFTLIKVPPVASHASRAGTEKLSDYRGERGIMIQPGLCPLLSPSVYPHLLPR